MPNLDTKAIEAELAAATDGPWKWPCGGGLWSEAGDRYISETPCFSYYDGVFIAHAPTHVRNLLDRVKELEDENIGLRFDRAVRDGGAI